MWLVMHKTAVSKVEGNVEVMNKAAEALTLKENDVTLYTEKLFRSDSGICK